MSTLPLIAVLVTILVAVTGATWALRAKLGDIEAALREHVAGCSVQLSGLAARVTRLEDKADEALSKKR